MRAFLFYRKIRPIKQKTLREDAHLADMKFVALQHRSGAKESQAILYLDGGKKYVSKL
jgi:hypothetical protein